MSKIDRNNVEDILSLTPMQSGMLIYYLKNPKSEIYFENLIINLRGNIDLNIFNKTWEAIIQKNEMLRTTFRWETIETPVQIILKQHKGNIEYYDAFTNNKTPCFEEINLNVDLRDIPFKVILYRYESERYKMVLCSHHILYDGWSTGIILREFFTIYHDLYKNTAPTFLQKGRYKDFVKFILNKNKSIEEDFWKKYFKGFEFSKINYFGIERNDAKCKSENYVVTLNEDYEEQINHFIKENEITLAIFIYTVWGLLLHKYSGHQDVVFGTTVSGRKANIPHIDNTVGLFINTIPLRQKFDNEQDIADLLQETMQMVKDREDFEHTSLVNIKKYSNSNTDTMFHSIVVLENYPLDKDNIKNNNLLTIESHVEFLKGEYELIINVAVLKKLEVTISYNPLYYSRELIGKIGIYFENILKSVLKCSKGKQLKIKNIDFIDDEEKQELYSMLSKDMENLSVDFDI